MARRRSIIAQRAGVIAAAGAPPVLASISPNVGDVFGLATHAYPVFTHDRRL